MDSGMLWFSSFLHYLEWPAAACAYQQFSATPYSSPNDSDCNDHYFFVT